MALIRVESTFNKFTIFADIVETGDDVVVIVGGGDSHIGAVGISFPTVSIVTGNPTVTTSVITIPSHKDDIVAKMVSESLSRQLNKKVVVVAGIHFDNLLKEEIENILDCCKNLISKIINTLG